MYWLIDKLHIDRYMNARLVLVIDLLTSLVATLLSMFLVRILSAVQPVSLHDVLIWLGCSLVFSFICFWALRTYRIIIRHSTLREISRFVAASAGKVLLLWVMALLWSGFVLQGVAMTMLLLLDFLFTMVLLTLIRVFMIIAYDIVSSRIQNSKGRETALIYGIDNKASSLVRTMQLNETYNVVGFIMYGDIEKNQIIQEKRVFNFRTESDFRNVIGSQRVDSIIFAHREDARAEENRLIKYSNAFGVKILYSPSVEEVVDGKVMRQPVRAIKIEDLLGRPEIKISMDEICENFSGKTVMVTGAAGSIGSELCRQLAAFGIRNLILFDNAETPMHNLRLELEERYPELSFIPVIGDVRLEQRLDYAFRKFRPQVVFHAAAYKHVPLMEENPCEAVLVNVAGSRNVADKCIEYDVEKMVMISTDKAVNPTNIMGCTKRLAEIYVQSLGLAIEQGRAKGKTKFVTTRFGNVLGSNGSVIPRFREQIAKGGPVTVTHPEITRFFMTIPEACRLVMEAATMSTGNQIFVFDMGESVKIAHLAKRMIELAGFEPDKDIKIEYTGLRPGEKLYEEVLSNTENTLPTSHDRIRIAKVREYGWSDACSVSAELERLSREVEIPDMVRLMKHTVPEFKSKNSRFEEFDKESK
ncbi:MAG: polysaccharide biosynthesis protein [Lachnospiraceae bacterium]|nr:polysaccharide biosynthesis protein [Clostridium sp.]MCM1218764.1 polysaccharide biosynthesis protein [Lachnospiraceae bacterium]